MQIREKRAEYLATVPDICHPISMELSSYISSFIQHRKISSACDIGSGFSSWLLRQFGIPRVVSYEVDNVWAEKTRALVGERAEILAFDSLGSERFDLVLLDSSSHGCGMDRGGMLEKVAEMVTPSGYIIVDDYNWDGFRYQVGLMAQQHAWPIVSLASETMDYIGRYAGLIGPCMARSNNATGELDGGADNAS